MIYNINIYKIGYMLQEALTDLIVSWLKILINYQFIPNLFI